MKIVLISLYEYETLGVRTLHSFIKNNGYDVYSIFFKKVFLNNASPITEKEFDLLINKIKELNPDIVGISLISTFLDLSKKITKLIKNSIDVPVIWGGAHPTLCPEECIKEADYICRGEGEYPLLELLNSLEKDSKKEHIKNIWINKKNKIIKNEMRDLINLDERVFPDWSNNNMFCIDNDKFEERDLVNKTDYNLIASRGCLFNCTYCCMPVFKRLYKGKGQYTKRRSVDNIMKELNKAIEDFPNLELINFWDDEFTANREWTLEFTKKFKEFREKTKTKPGFDIQVHPKFCDDEILSSLKDAGLNSLRIGIQNGSEEMVNKLFKRAQTNKDLIEISKRLKKHKVAVGYDILTDTPFETEKEKIATLDLLLKLEKPFTLDFYSLLYLPHTELTNYALEKGKITKEGIEQIRKKALSNWRMRLDLQKENENKFYYSLYILTQTFTPRFIIKYISKNKFLKNHPELVMRLRYTKLFHYIKPGLKDLLSGDFNAIKRGLDAFR